jgi:hypothetical protein
MGMSLPPIGPNHWPTVKQQQQAFELREMKQPLDQKDRSRESRANKRYDVAIRELKKSNIHPRVCRNSIIRGLANTLGHPLGLPPLFSELDARNILRFVRGG